MVGQAAAVAALMSCREGRELTSRGRVGRSPPRAVLLGIFLVAPGHRRRHRQIAPCCASESCGAMRRPLSGFE